MNRRNSGGVADFAAAASQKSARIKFELEAPKQFESELLGNFTASESVGRQSSDGQIQTKNGVAVATVIISGLALLPNLMAAVLDLRDRLTDGVLIDARREPIKIVKDPTLPQGMIVVLDKNGRHPPITNSGKNEDIAKLVEQIRTSRK
jgi:hypothetical protein